MCKGSRLVNGSSNNTNCDEEQRMINNSNNLRSPPDKTPTVVRSLDANSGNRSLSISKLISKSLHTLLTLSCLGIKWNCGRDRITSGRLYASCNDRPLYRTDFS